VGKGDVLAGFQRKENGFELVISLAGAAATFASSGFEEGVSREQKDIHESKEEGVRVILRACMRVSSEDRRTYRNP